MTPEEMLERMAVAVHGPDLTEDELLETKLDIQDALQELKEIHTDIWGLNRTAFWVSAIAITELEL